MIEANENFEIVEDEARASKKFGVIVADPPWSFSDKLKYSGDVKRAADNFYPTLNLAEIKKLPIGELAEENCILALWVPSAFLQAGMDVMEAWGFQYKQLWIWGKTFFWRYPR